MRSKCIFATQILILSLIALVDGQSCIKCYSGILDQCYVQSQNQIVSNYLSFSFEIPNLHNMFYDLAYNQKIFELHEDIQDKQKQKYSINEIYTSILESLLKSKKNRQKNGELIQSSRRSFTISQLFHFKRWYSEQSQSNKSLIKLSLQNQYLQIIEASGVNFNYGIYYLDIISLYQTGLIYLKQQLNYVPKIGFANSLQKTNLMILKLLGFQLILSQDLEQINDNKNSYLHLLKINKATNQDQNYFKLPIMGKKVVSSFNFNNSQKCQVLYEEIKQFQTNFQTSDKSNYRITFMNISKFKLSNSYFNSVQKIMDQYARQKCRKTILSYGNYKYFSQNLNSQYLKTINHSELIRKQQSYFNSIYHFSRKFSDYLRSIQKIFFLDYLTQQKSLDNIKSFQILQKMKTIQILLLRDKLILNDELQYLLKQMQMSLKQSDKILSRKFQKYFSIQTINPLLICNLGICNLPENHLSDILIKILNFQFTNNIEKVQFKLPKDQFYQPLSGDQTYFYQCEKETKSCFLIIYMKFYTYSILTLRKVNIQKISQKIGYYKNIFKDQNIKLDKKSSTCVVSVGNTQIQINMLNLRKNNYQILVLKNIKRYSNSIEKKYKLEWSSGYVGYLQFTKNKSNSVFFNFPMHNNIQNQTIFQAKVRNMGKQFQSNYFSIDSNGLLPKRINESKQWVDFSKYIKYFSQKKQLSFWIDNAFSAARKTDNNIIQIKLPHLLTTSLGLFFKIALYVSQNGEQLQYKIFQSEKIIQINSVEQSKRISIYKPNWQKIDKWKQIAINYDNIKFFVKIYNQTSGILTVINQNARQVQINLFADSAIPILSIFYGSLIKASSIQEVTIGGNIKYQHFISNLTLFQFHNIQEEKQFYEKTFKQQITLKPFSIRSFQLTNLSSDIECQSKFKFTKKIMNYSFKQQKQKDQNQLFQTWEDAMKKFLMNGNHCTQQSPATKAPVLKQKQVFNKIQIIDSKKKTMKQKLQQVKQANRKDIKQNKKQIDLQKNLHNFLTKQEQISIKEKTKQKRQQEIDSDIYLKVDQEQFISIKQKIMRRQRIERKQKFIYFKQKLFRIKQSSF